LAALSLARRGADVTVLERSKSFAEVGAGIQLAPNAIRILDQLDVLDAIMPAAVMPRRLVLADAVDGRELTSLDLTDFPARYGAPYLVLHRGDLLNALLSACVAHGVRLHADASVAELTDTGTATVAACADGREFTAQVAIGADGLHSRIRKYFVDDEPILSGFVAYRGAVPMEEVERHADLRDVVAWLGPGLHLVQYPLRSGRMYNQVAVFASEALLRGDPDWGGPAELTAAFAGCCEHVRTSLSTLSIDNRWPMADRLPMRDWVRAGWRCSATRPIPCCSTSPKAPARPWRTRPSWPPSWPGRPRPAARSARDWPATRPSAPRGPRACSGPPGRGGRSGTWAGWPSSSATSCC
jgi:salicylate hydroxylase